MLASLRPGAADHLGEVCQSSGQILGGAALQHALARSLVLRLGPQQGAARIDSTACLKRPPPQSLLLLPDSLSAAT